MTKKKPSKKRTKPAAGGSAAKGRSESKGSDSKAVADQLKRLDLKLVEQLNRRTKLRVKLDELARGEPSAASWLESSGDIPPKTVLRANRGPLEDSTIQAIFRQLEHAGEALRSAVSVAYLGPELSYSHLAAMERFGESSTLVPLPRIASVFTEVAAGRVSFGVVPLENSTDGRIADTLEMLAKLEVRICGEVPASIHHQLLGTGDRAGITKVCSKAQAISQCRGWLSKNLPQASLQETSSTTVAAELAAQDPSVAAIASAAAGQYYGLKTLASDIEDNPHNVTRFAVISLESAPKTGRDKTALLVQLAHEPGALAEAMMVFKRSKLNMTWIESFPMPATPREYLFFFEFEGHERDLRVRKALAQLEKKTRKLDLLGSYGVWAAPSRDQVT